MKPHKHRPVQHRDGKPPWCEECGLTSSYKTPVSIMDQMKENPNMIQTTTYVRKPFEVEAIEVTEENIEEVAEWCQGTLQNEANGRQFIKVRVTRPLNERQTKAFVGDWILYAGTGFKVYTAKAFKKTFEKQTGEAHDAAVQAEKERPEELRTVSVAAGHVGGAGGGSGGGQVTSMTAGEGGSAGGDLTSNQGLTDDDE